MSGEAATRYRRFALRFVAWTLVLLALLTATAQRVQEQALPWLGLAITAFSPGLRTEALTLDRQGSDRVIRLTVSHSRFQLIGGRALDPQMLGTADASTPAGTLLLVMALVAATACAWPAQGLTAWCLRLPFTAAAVLAGLALDTPVVLLAAIWGLYLDAFAAGTVSLLGLGSAFLMGGGRYALAIGLGLAAGGLSNRVYAWLAPDSDLSQADQIP